jgi:hypothetical protein
MKRNRENEGEGEGEGQDDAAWEEQHAGDLEAEADILREQNYPLNSPKIVKGCSQPEHPCHFGTISGPTPDARLHVRRTGRPSRDQHEQRPK